MRLLLKIIAAVFLLFNGSAAIYGGLMLVLYPDGSALHLSLDLLEHSIFNNYLIPGLALLLLNGLFSLYVIILILLNSKRLWYFVALQGLILLVWLVIQIFMIRLIYPLHLVMFGVGLGLMSVGLFAKRSFATDVTYEEI
jgi:hypothetical protein